MPLGDGVLGEGVLPVVDVDVRPHTPIFIIFTSTSPGWGWGVGTSRNWMTPGAVITCCNISRASFGEYE